MATSELGLIENQRDMTAVEGTWKLDEDDWLLLAMLCDPIYCAELLFEDPLNHTHGGCYVVLDYQYPLFRPQSTYQAFPCARSVGKTESIKARSVTHAFKRRGEDLLLTAPELIHLEALTQHVEQRISEVRLTRDFLKKDSQKTGFTHKPFMVEFADGTRIIGRIPRLTGTGVKGMHEPDLIIDEAQDYPPKGWTEVHECQPLGAPVMTPHGPVPIGFLRPGDTVQGVAGPTEVRAVHERGEREVLRVHFADGSVVECDEDHLWTVARNKRANEWRVKKTSEIEAALNGDGRAGSRKEPYFVPHPAAVEQAGGGLRVHPYVLGVLLGDGCTSSKRSVRLSNPESFIIERVNALLPDAEFRATGSSCKEHHLRKRVPGRRKAILQENLEELPEVWGRRSYEKSIPEKYLLAPIQDRLELLRGLIDTDGSIDARSGATLFGSTSRPLVDGVAQLVKSLGGNLRRGVQKDERGFRTMYTVRFRLGSEQSAAALPRKNGRAARTDSMRKNIVKIDRTGTHVPMRCIEVAAHDGLYLTGDYIPTHNTVMKDHVDSTGKYDFTYHFYGVHAGANGGRFESLAQSGDFKVTAITALMKPGWNKAEKAAAAAMYGGTHAPDYRRNILGEPGTALSQFFVSSRLMACLDQDADSAYNTVEFKDQHLMAEDVDKMLGPNGDIAALLDLPSNLGQFVYGGMDVGLINDPTVIMLFALQKDKEKKERLKLVRMLHLWRFRERQIREVAYRIDLQYGKTLRAFGQDITGLGLPLLQAMEDDEKCPEHLREVGRGYTFNALVPVAVDENYVSEVGGKMVDQYGNMVKVERDKWTGQDRYVSYMTMIEASTRYLRNMVDQTYLLLPFHQGLVKDMQGETEQRVRAMGSPHLRKKPSAFHMLDSMRAMAMAYKSSEVEEMVLQPSHRPVLERAVDFTGGAVGGGMAMS